MKNGENKRMKTRITMKKLIVCCVAFAALFASCTIEDEVPLNVYTQIYTVHKNDWKVGDDDASGIYFYYEFREPALSQYIYERGVMQAFLHLKDDNISPLPFNDFWVNGNYQWTEQVTCEFRPGYITFILKYSDHNLIEPHYDDYTFNVRLAW